MGKLCPVWVEKMVKVAEPAPGQDHLKQAGGQLKMVRVPKRRVIPCGKRTSGLVEVSYSKLFTYRKGENKFEDLFALCSEHFEALKEEPEAWRKVIPSWHPGRASGLRGHVSSVRVVEVAVTDMAATVRREAADRTIAFIKKDLKRKMRQENAKHLSIDDWRRMYAEIVDEFVAEEVMLS